MSKINYYQFDKIAKFIDYRGRTPKKTEKGIPLITAKNIKFGYLSEEPREFIAESDYDEWMTRGIPTKGDILFTTEAPLGNVCLLNTSEKRAFAQRAIIFQSLNNNIYISEYLFYYLMSPPFMEELDSKKTGTTVKGIKSSILKKFKIPLPPLQEQKRIVAKLDTLFEKIDKAIALHQKNMDEADVFMGSVLNDVFGEFKTTKNISLKDITTKIGSGSTPRGGQKAYKTEGISLIRSMNVHDNGFRDKGLAFIDDEQAKKLDNVTVKENDVLLNITGASVARCCIVDKNYLPARVNQHVSILRLKDEIIPRFLHYYLVSPSIKAELLQSSLGGATREAITKAMLEEFQVPLVSFYQQQKTVTYLDKISLHVNKLKQVQKEKMQSLVALKASILDQAFRGKL